MKTVGVLTISDTASQGLRQDLSGPEIERIVTAAGLAVVERSVVADEVADISQAIKTMSKRCDLILTTGGTGLSPRDVTPEATATVIDKEIPGISEAIRAQGMLHTKRAMLTRGKAGSLGNSIVVNMPGSPKAVAESLPFILPSLIHGSDILQSKAHDCARKD